MTLLADFCKSLAPGTWGEFTSQNIDPVIGVGPDQFPLLRFGGPAPWDRLGKKIKFITGTHGFPPREIEYSDETNTWRTVDDNSPLYGSVHSFDHHSVNPYTGEHYAWTQNGGTGDSDLLRKRGAWERVVPKITAGFNQTASIGTCWWGGPFAGLGAQGGWMGLSAMNGQLVAFDPLANTWPVSITGLGATGRYSPLMEYSRKKNCAVFGGGHNNSAPDGLGESRKLWRLDADRSVHAMPDAPQPFAIWAGMQFIDEPVTGNFLAIGFGKFYELNPDGAGKWTELPAPPAEIKIPERLYGTYPEGSHCTSIVSVPDYGVVILIHAQRLRSPKVKMFVYKHAEIAAPAPVGDSWQRDSTAPGVLLAVKFDKDADILPHRGANQNVDIDQVVCHVDPDGSAHLRINVKAESANPTMGQYWRRIIPAWDSGNHAAGAPEPLGMGTEPLWQRFDVRIPASRLVPPTPDSAASGMGPKCFILGNYYNSSTANSFAITTIYGRDFPQVYNHTNQQSNGAALSEYHDGFWDMTPGWRTDAGQYCVYADYRYCPKWIPGVWRTFLMRVRIADYDQDGNGSGAGNELDVWIKDEDDKPRLLITKRNFPSGYNPQYPGGPNTVHFVAYETNRSQPGVATFTDYRNLIVSKNEIPMPGGSPAQPPKENVMPTKAEIEAALAAQVLVINKLQDVAASATAALNAQEAYRQASIQAAIERTLAENPSITAEQLSLITTENEQSNTRADELSAAVVRNTVAAP